MPDFVDDNQANCANLVEGHLKEVETLINNLPDANHRATVVDPNTGVTVSFNMTKSTATQVVSLLRQYLMTAAMSV